MQRDTIVLLWGKPVASAKGWAGRVQGALLAPRASRVTHVVVRCRFPARVRTEELEGAQQDDMGKLTLPEANSHRGEGPARGSVPLTPKTVVRTADAAALPLQGLVLNARDLTITYLLVGSGNNARAVPNGSVVRLNSGTPALALKQADVEALPVYAPDHDALANALAALETSDSSGGAFRRVQVEVQDGAARLSGNVRFSMEKAEAEKAVAAAKGVLGVQNEIVADWDLSIAIAETLAREGVTRHGLVTVKAYLGDVTLHGHLAAQDLVEQAVVLAGGTPGVRSVAHDIQVKPLPSPISLAMTT